MPIELLFGFFFFIIPIAAVVFFVISLCLYCSALSKNKKVSDTFQPSAIRSRLILLIVSSVIMGVLLLVVIGFIVLLYMSISYM